MSRKSSEKERNEPHKTDDSKQKDPPQDDDLPVLGIDALRQKVKYLEEELVRKDDTIEKIKRENLILFKTALKNSEDKADRKSFNEKASK